MPDMKANQIIGGNKVNASLKRVLDANQPGRHMKELIRNTSPQKSKKRKK